jgi:hypothetical protein
MKTKRLNALDKAQVELYNYIHWCEESGRLTTDEHDKLLVLISHVEAQIYESSLA